MICGILLWLGTDLFTHIIQDYLTGTGALPQFTKCQYSNLKHMDK